MATSGNSRELFGEFLSEFSAKEAPGPESPLPFRLQCQNISEDECKGEILNLASVYLESAKCPEFLKYCIASHVTESLISTSLERFMKERDHEKEDTTVYYNATKLAKETFSAVHDVCAKWNENLPNQIEPRHLNAYSVCGIKNTRRKMEDKHVVITDLNACLNLKDQPPTQYYGVFDGHGGLDASTYTAKQLHLRLVNQKSYQTDVEEALKKSILDIDNQYCKKCNRESLRSGTTAAVTVLRENKLYLAWIGDSQAVLVRNGRAVTLMEPHKPDREDEKKRIESLGGCVIWFGAWRVNGTLSVSRAIGDADHKPYVCGDADTSKTVLDGTEDYLCLACDGFWDVFTGDELVVLVAEHMKGSGDKTSLARFLCMKAKDAGSTDNITVLIVFLRDDITPRESPESGAQVVENDENDVKSDTFSSETNGVSENSNNSNNSEELKGAAGSGNVMIQGNKLEPAVKDRPPHKLFVNKPSTINSKVNVIVTESSPHLKLPRSVVTHKSPWNSPQISPQMKRRDTRGSLLSWSTLDSSEITVPLNIRQHESQTNGPTTQAHGFFPPLVQEFKSGNLTSLRTSPSPSWTSEPVSSEEGQSLASIVHPPKQPSVQRHNRGRVPYRTSIVMSHLNNVEHEDRIGHQRRISRSVPENLQRIHENYIRQRRSRVFAQNQSNRQSKKLEKGVPVQTEHSTFREFQPNAVFDTDIAITNSLYNTIKPKKTSKRDDSLLYMKTNAKIPVKVLYRRHRSRSVL